MPLQPIAFNFDVSNIDPYVAGSDPLPSGSYVMEIREMEVRANNKKDSGHNLALTYVVTEGEFKGRKVFDNLNLWHATASSAVEIAFKQLSSIGHAVGVLSGGDLTMLANKPMLVEVALEAATQDTVNPNTGENVKGRPASNRIVRRDPVGSNAAPVSVPNAAQAASAPAMAPAAAAQPAAAPAQAAPAFTPPAAAQPQAQPAAAAAAPTGTPGAGGVPPWMANKAA